jgi:hypothetical protein
VLVVEVELGVELVSVIEWVYYCAKTVSLDSTSSRTLGVLTRLRRRFRC